MSRWRTQPSEWALINDALVRAARNNEPIGLDTEFDSVNIGEESPVGRSRIVCWSIAVYHGGVHPRGYRKAFGVTLPPEAIDYFAVWLQSHKLVKVLHNEPVDNHAFANQGVTLANTVNTLSLARWMWPGRATYDLKSLARDLLGIPETRGFVERFSRPAFVDVTKKESGKSCACGEPKCRKRKEPEHAKTQWERSMTQRVERGIELIPLAEIVADRAHFKYEELGDYAAEDSEWALGVYSLAERDGQRLSYEVPWAV